MIIREAHVKNFRSILEESLSCDCLTALVGRNGAGKSSFLRALEMFYDPSSKVTVEDFYAEDPSHDIEIAITFSDLTTEEHDFFSAYVDGDSLTVVRVFSLAPGRKSGTYHGMRLQNPDFAEVRRAGSKTDVRNKYDEVRSRQKYASLPGVGSADKALEALDQWEGGHPQTCERLRDDGQFFGFTEVGRGYLGRHTRFIKVPAVRDASDDATEKRGSCVTEIMDLVVRSVLGARKDVRTFRDETRARYKDILDPRKLKELTTLQTEITNTLKHYAPDASVSLRWAESADINIPMPEAEVKLLEDGYESTVQRTGHGLQRAFILTMLQHLIAAREIEKATEEGVACQEDIPTLRDPHLPSLVLAIEEPELYQHPSRQRHMASVLLQLAQGSIPGVAKKTQVIYSTHAPLFVGLDRFDQIRLLRKESYETGKPKVTAVAEAALDKVAEDLWKLDGQPGDRQTPDTLRPRMQAVMTSWMNEGFFADVIALVEGEGDRAAILAVAESMGHELESMGVCVVPCMGKSSLDRPAVVFRNLGIRTYLVWDNDKNVQGSSPEENKRLLRLVGATVQDWPAGVWDTHACLDGNLQCALRQEISEAVFDNLLDRARTEFRMKKRQAQRNPFVLRWVIEEAAKQGHSSSTLKAIVEKIVGLRLTETEQDR
jgi:putative ATP-dependent endonuclease of OLD family